MKFTSKKKLIEAVEKITKGASKAPMVVSGIDKLRKGESFAEMTLREEPEDSDEMEIPLEVIGEQNGIVIVRETEFGMGDAFLPWRKSWYYIEDLNVRDQIEEYWGSDLLSSEDAKKFFDWLKKHS